MNNILEYFFEGYFHQDWRVEHLSSFETIEAFLKEEPIALKIELQGALYELLEKEDLSSDTINKFGGNLNPESEGFQLDKRI